ncbi:MAG: 4-(cytidine 5'-diphospho)-2-C-methyl-D-erythritol kinase [Rhodospirillaceae bacterium]|nr:4-(cytidine 5'-diphospho)-2-C-methyl-D-erythritol kinase [Rhodospirillaceae bacterium]|tara:strand:+ start:426 stop:1319 length:894 start_codon:yes stop_codon:yes gene_type:complete
MTVRTGDAVTVKARAKINLYLHVLGRREDGYHELDSLFVFGEIADLIDVRPSRSLRLEVKGKFGEALPERNDNLIVRAARLLADAVQIKPNAEITLTKNLPVAAGLGGGSADAAAALRALAVFWEIPPDSVDLTLLGLGLGADIPACLLSEPCFVGGVGELVEPVPDFPSVPILLVNPGEALATASVFAGTKQKFSKRSRFETIPDSVDGLVSTLNSRRNDLEGPAIELCPLVAEVLQAIRATDGCRLARMSGSGATCFGLYGDVIEAREAAKSLRCRGWWSEATVTASAQRPWADI